MAIPGPWGSDPDAVLKLTGAEVVTYWSGPEDDLDWALNHRIRELKVIGPIGDDSAVRNCSSLEVLVLNTDGGKPLDVSRLTKLRDLSVNHFRLDQSSGVPPSLRRLRLYEYGFKDLNPVASQNAVGVSELLVQSRRLCSLRGIENLRLETLQVAATKRLTDFAGIGSQVALRRLRLVSCSSLRSVAVLAGLSSLELLSLESCGVIESLLPLRGIPLKGLLMTGSTTVADRNVRFLAQDVGVSSLTIERMKDYDMERAELPEDPQVDFLW